MADVSQIKLPNGTTYTLKDDGALQLTGGNVTGSVSFGDSVSIDDLNAGQLIVSGSASITNNLQVNTINGIAVGSSPKFTDIKVTQTNSTTNADYRILLSASANDTTETNTSLKNTNLRYNPSMGALKIKGFNSISSNYKSINSDVSKAEITAQDSSLTIDSDATNWFQALVKAICVKYPSQTNTLFRGTFAPNSYKSYEVFIYDTSEVDSTTKLPRHSFGRALGYGTSYVKFGTADYVWTYVNVNTDTKVTQSVSTATSWRKVLVHYSTNTAQADVPSTITNQVYATKGVEIQPSTGTLSARQLNIYAEGTTTANTPATLQFIVKDTTTEVEETNSYIKVYNDHGTSGNGTNMVIRSGGAMFIGGGEAPSAHYAEKGAAYTGEVAFITADTNVYIQGGGSTIADRVGFYVNASHQVIPCAADAATNNVGSIGTSSYKWANLYVTNINGTAVPAITAATAGTSSATSGNTLAVPYVTYNAKGMITAAGTHTHTIFTYGTSDLTAGTSALTTGTLYCVYV